MGQGKPSSTTGEHKRPRRRIPFPLTPPRYFTLARSQDMGNSEGSELAPTPTGRSLRPGLQNASACAIITIPKWGLPTFYFTGEARLKQV